MGKIIRKAAVVLVYIGIMSFFIYSQLPDFGKIVPKAVLAPGGRVLLAQNTENTNYIYGVDAQGAVRRIYVHRGDVYQIMDMAYEDGMTYFLEYCEFPQENRYRLYRISQDWRYAEEVCEFAWSTSTFLMDLTISGNAVYFTGIDNLTSTGFVDRYGMDDGGQWTERVEQGKIPSGFPVKAVYTGDTLYILSDMGAVYSYKEGVGSAFREELTSWITESDGGLVYHDLEQDKTYFAGTGRNQALLLGEYARAQDVQVLREDGAQAVLYGGSPRRLVLTWGGGEQTVTGLIMDVASLVKLLGFSCIVLTLSYAAGVGILVLILYALRRQRTLALKLAALILFCDFFFILLLTGYLYRNNTRARQDGRVMSTRLYIMQTDDEMTERIHLDDIDPGNFVNTEYYDIVHGIMSSWITSDEDGNEILFSQSLVYREPENAYILESREYAYGRKVEGIYDAEVVETIYDLPDGDVYGRVFAEEKGVIYIYVIVPARNVEGNKLFYVARGGTKGIWEQRRDIMLKSIRLSLGCGLAMASILLIIIYRMLRPIRRLCKEMGRVAEGSYELAEELFPDNELGDMWIYLHKMCKALRVQQYSKANVLNYYYRFAPKGFETLFGKEKLQEIAVGYTAAVEGTMGILSVGEKEQFLKSRLPGEYVRVINQMLDIIGNSKERGKGVLLSNDSNLESLKILYRDGERSADEALGFLIQSICALDTWDSAGMGIAPAAVVHTCGFICGLAGTGEQAYPFATSMEMEWLAGYVNRFRENGIKLVITEPVRNRLRGRYDMRYIGFLNPPEAGPDIELYEVLEVYARKEKYGKKKADTKFQEALRLFYDGNFYPARNCFMEALKICPEDGVAKWYLFKCEERSEGGEGQKAQLHLF